ncbi:hypothetical protein Q3G72_026471 [Acer saccharum]|nr:hypothetical protein Q3G72_026471 [Acer saccharum]
MAPGHRLSAFTMVDSSGDDTSDVNCKGKKRKCHGVTRGLKVNKIVQSVGRIPIRFTLEQKEPICENANNFSTEMGILVRQFAPLQVVDWSHMPEVEKNTLFYRLIIRSKRNSKSRNALKIKHRGGSKSIRRLVEEMEEMQKLEGELTHDETPPTDVEIIERVLGPRSAYIKGFRKVHKTLMSSIPSSSTQEVEMIALKAELESTQEELRIAKEKSVNT